MPLDTQDFDKGVDFTGINPATGGDHNNLIELSVPRPTDATASIGKGMPITTTDSASDIPVVPDAATNTKWKRYTWNRRPFAGETDKSIKTYHWNDDATNDATYLKWVRNTDAEDALSLANNALSTAEDAVTTALAASTTANAAVVTANAASATATAASVTAAAAQVDATTAITNAATALAAASTAQNKADLAYALAGALKDPSLALNPGTSFQRIRTTSAGTSVEWFSIVNTYAKFTEAQNKGTDAGGSSAGKNTRVLNTEDADTGGLVTLAAGVMTFAIAGIYYIRAWANMFDNGNNTHQLLVVKDSDNTTLLTGRSMTFVSGGSTTQASEVSGYITVTAGMAIRLDHYITNAQAANGLGQAANIHPDVTGKEIYACCEIYLL